MQGVVRLLSTLALKAVVQRLAARYENVTGTRLDADFAPTRGLLDRLRGHEAADLVILTREGLAQIAREGLVIANSRVDLARSYVGVAVKAGEPHPDIATEAGLRVALRRARAVAYSRIGASGILFAQLIERMGIAEEINARAIVVPAGLTAERLLSGEADLAVQQISELSQVSGVEIIGAIPCELQTATTFSAGIMAASERRAKAERLLLFLASPEVAGTLREAGLEPCVAA